MDGILKAAGMAAAPIRLTEVMTLNRLVQALEDLAESILKAAEKGKPLADDALGERIGRLRERYCRTAR